MDEKNAELGTEISAQASQLLDTLPSNYFVVESCDGKIMVLPGEIAAGSKLLQSLMAIPQDFVTDESQNKNKNHVRLENIDGKTLTTACNYLCYRFYHSAKSMTNLPDFPIKPDEALEVLKASNILDC
ncbi:MAG: Transcription elongation factor B (SIII), polypeptide 1 (15kDa, elongin C) [Paramarteilia canceri]